jgi:hypothetical protein
VSNSIRKQIQGCKNSNRFDGNDPGTDGGQKEGKKSIQELIEVRHCDRVVAIGSKRCAKVANSLRMNDRNIQVSNL